MSDFFTTPKVEAAPPPDPDKASKEADEARQREARSKESFARRFSFLGPLQLSTPGLPRERRR